MKSIEIIKSLIDQNLQLKRQDESLLLGPLDRIDKSIQLREQVRKRKGDLIQFLRPYASVDKDRDNCASAFKVQEAIVASLVRGQIPNQSRVEIVLSGEFCAISFGKAWEAVKSRHFMLNCKLVMRENANLNNVVIRNKSEPILSDCVISMDPVQDIGIELLGDTRCRISWSFSHAYIDRWSVKIIFEEILEMYRQILSGTPSNASVRDHIVEYFSWVNRQDTFSMYAFWRRYIDRRAGRTLSKLTSKNVRRDLTPCYSAKEFRLEDADTFISAIKRSHFSVSEILISCWAMTLAKHSGTDKVSFALAVSGRSAQLYESYNRVGPYAMAVPCQVSVVSAKSLAYLVHSVREAVISVNETCHIGVKAICDITDIDSFPGFCDTLISIDSFGFNRDTERWMERLGLNIHSVSRDKPITGFPISIQVVIEDCMRIDVMFDETRFEKEIVESLVGHFKKVIEATASGIDFNCITVDKFLEAIDAVGVADADINCHEVVADHANNSLVSFLRHAVSRQPRIVEGARQVESADLMIQASHVSKFLQNRGLTSGANIAVISRPGEHIIPMVVGILMSGMIYIPIDPMQREERVSSILKECNPALIICQEQALSSIDAEAFKEIVTVKTLFSTSLGSTALPAINIELGGYCIFTSGTTGIPKRIFVSTKQLSLALQSFNEVFQVGAKDNFACVSSIGFDISLVEFLLPAINGASVTFVDFRSYSYSELLFSAYADVTVCHFVPSLLDALLDIADRQISKENVFDSVRLLLIGGEPISARQKMRFQRRFTNAVIIELYGPTENTILSTYNIVDADTVQMDNIIGEPFPHVETFLGDAEDLGDGEVFTLLLGGQCISQSVGVFPWPRSEVSLKSKAVYRTGDIVRSVLTSGGVKKLQYVGREDSQVKINGIRVDLSAMEKKINEIVGIERCVVFLGSIGTCSTILVFFKSEIAMLREEDIYSILGDQRLPVYIEEVSEFPLNQNDKLDYRHLEARWKQRVERESSKSEQDGLYDQLANIWRSLGLAVTRGALTNMYSVGGDSLKALALIALVNRKLSTSVLIEEFIGSPTLGNLIDLARKSSSNLVSDSRVSENPELDGRVQDGWMKLSAYQELLWFECERLPDVGIYNMYGGYNVYGFLDVTALNNAIEALLAKYPVLTSRLSYSQYDPGLLVSDVQNIPLLINSGFISDQDIRAEIGRICKTPINLYSDSLFDLHVFSKVGNREHSVILFRLHHIIGDAHSLDVIKSELFSLYNEYCLNKRIEPSVGRVVSRERDAWMATPPKLEKIAEISDRVGRRAQQSVIFECPPEACFDADIVTYRIDEADTDILREAARKLEVSPFSIVWSLFCESVTSQLKIREVIVNTPLALHDGGPSAGGIGLNIRGILLRYQQEKLDLIRQIQCAHLHITESIKDASVPITNVFNELLSKFGSGYRISDLTIGWTNIAKADTKLDGLTITRYDTGVRKSRQALEIYFRNGETTISVEIHYRKNSFKSEQVSSFIGNALNELKELNRLLGTV